MKIKLIEGYHMTATRKRHVAEMISRGMMKGGTSRLWYEFESVENSIAKLTCYEDYVDDYGRKNTRKSNYTVQFTA